MKTRHYASGFGAAVLLMCAGQALAAEPADSMLRWYAPPGEFYLDDQIDVEVLNYSEPRDVRICLDTRRHDINLAIERDGKEMKLKDGNCTEFDAKRVSISPASDLGSEYDLSGTIETR